MPLFQINGKQLQAVKLINFNLEKELQALVETNLQTVFNCKFIATEFSTGAEHAGRIDTLALSEDNNPVIIEYKKVESSELINQSLFYMSWLSNHRGDFQLAVNKSLKQVDEVDWTDIRVICIAPGYKKYDLHAVQMMGANIELWQYKLFDNGSLYLEEVFRKSTSLTVGKKAAITRATGSYTFEQHLESGNNAIKELALELQEFILTIDDSIEEAPKKNYIAYKVTQNFVCMEIQKNKILLFLKLIPSQLEEIPQNGRDVTNIGHFGTGDFELTIKNKDELAEAFKYIEMAYGRIGG